VTRAVRGEVHVVPATSDRWQDVAMLLDGETGAERGCWCQSWRGRDAIARATDETRPETLRRQLANDSPPPGFIAYVGGEPAGWAGVSVRTTTPRLVGSRTIPAIDDQPVWSIGCFRIRTGYRRQGVATALLDAIVDAARAAGAPGVEAYPVDPGGRRIDVGFAFVGIASMFDRAGFRRVLETNAHSAGLPRLLVRLDLPQDAG
jgi:GNAT superfamily N-acetyltransferase